MTSQASGYIAICESDRFRGGKKHARVSIGKRAICCFGRFVKTLCLSDSRRSVATLHAKVRTCSSSITNYSVYIISIAIVIIINQLNNDASWPTVKRGIAEYRVRILFDEKGIVATTMHSK